MKEASSSSSMPSETPPPSAPSSSVSPLLPPPPPPPPDAEHVTPCGGVLKSVLVEAREGAERPPLHSRCLVQYEGFLGTTGESFVKSAEEGRGTGEPAVVVAGRDASLRATGLNLAVLKMKRGEKARVWVEDAARFGYGPRGSFSFPAVPPLAKLVYEVELVAFEPPEDSSGSEEEEVEKEKVVEGENNNDGEAKPKPKRKKEKRTPRPAGSLTYEERLEAASRRKLKGNALLTGTGAGGAGGSDTKEKDPAAALSQYRLSLSYLDDDFLFQLEGPHLEAASELARAVRLNCAAAKLALGDARGAAADASEVLKERPRDAKALFRRGKAKRALGDARGAADDFRQASRELEGKDAGILRELTAAEAEVKAASRAGDEVFRRAFAKSVGKGKLFKEEEEVGEKKEGEDEPVPFTFDDNDESASKAAAPSSSSKSAGASLSAPLVVLLAVAALVVAAAAARWGRGGGKKE